MTTMSEAFERAGASKVIARSCAAKFLELGGTREDWIAAFDEEAAERMSGEGQQAAAEDSQIDTANSAHPMRSEGQSEFADSGHQTHADVPHPMLSKGHVAHAENGHSTSAKAQHPLPGKGHSCVAEGHLTHADARQPNTSEGQRTLADNGLVERADAGAPIASGKGRGDLVRKDQSGAANLAREPSVSDLRAMKEASDFVYFETIRLRNKAWTSYRFSQLKNVGAINLRENMLIKEVVAYQRDHRIPDDRFVHMSIPVTEMKKIIQRVNNSIPSRAALTFAKKKKERRHG